MLSPMNLAILKQFMGNFRVQDTVDMEVKADRPADRHSADVLAWVLTCPRTRSPAVI